jgi:hypothetical protein
MTQHERVERESGDGEGSVNSCVTTVSPVMRAAQTWSMRLPSSPVECPLIVYTDLDIALCQAIAQTVGQPMEWKIPR